MDDFLEIEGKSLDEAIFVGLERLGLSIDEARIDVLEDASKGFLGIGQKLARVRISRKREEAEAPAAEGAGLFLSQLLSKMGYANARVSEAEQEDTCVLSVRGGNAAALIGRRGETMEALQHLVSLAATRENGQYRRILVDVEGYREKRQHMLEQLAHRTASNVARSGRRFSLEPMNPYERRIVHFALQNDRRVTTQSEGEEPYRRVVILPAEKES